LGSQGSQLPPLFVGEAIYWPRQLTESDITDLNSLDRDKKRSARNKIIEKCEQMSRNGSYEALSKLQHELIFAKYHHHFAIQLKELLHNRHYDELLSLLRLIIALQFHTNIRHYHELMQYHWLLASMHMAEANQEILIEIATSSRHFCPKTFGFRQLLLFPCLLAAIGKCSLHPCRRDCLMLYSSC
jgi:hypothetical protein